MTKWKLITVVLFIFQITANAALDSSQIEHEIIVNLENIAGLDTEKIQLEQKISDLETKIRERKRVLNQRTRALSYLQKFQWGGLLANEDPHVVERNLKIVKQLNRYDLNLFKDYKSSLKALALTRKNLATTQKQLKSVLASLQRQQALLNSHEDERRSKLVESKQPSLLNLKGELARPLVGELQLNFGSRPDKQNQYVFISKGHLFNTKPGEQIKSVGPGVIIFRDHLPHWRETLIIQHEDNYYSVYAGVSAQQKKVQDRVEKDEVIALTAANEFYFELRHFENPINPNRWFKESL